MARESGETAVSITLSESLSQWLDAKAGEQGVSREDLLVQLLAAYQTLSGMRGDERANADGGATVIEQFDEFLSKSEARVDARLDDRVDQAVADRVGDVRKQVDEEVTERVEEAVSDTVDDQVTERVAETVDEIVAARLEARIDQRVDARLDARLDAILDDRLEDLEAPADDLEARVDAILDERLEDVLESRLDDVLESRLDEVLDSRVDEALESRLDDALEERLEAQVADVREDFMAKIEDARERVIQVKREADAKAPKEHGHPQLESRLAGIQTEIDSIEADVAAAKSTADTVQETVQTGFENYREVLQFLSDRADTLNGRINTLARALLETREEIRKLAARDAARSAAEDIKRRANQQGIESAQCAECEVSVDVGLLTRAECPHCNSPFADVEPARGFFGQHRLVPGERPALESGDGGDDAGAQEAYDVGVEAVIDDSGTADPADGLEEGEPTDADGNGDGEDGTAGEVGTAGDDGTAEDGGEAG